MIGWGEYERKCRLLGKIKKIPIRRFRCKKCKRTFNYLPPFLIAFKQYDLGSLGPSLLKIFEQGAAYLKATPEKIDFSTIFRYTQYYLCKSKQIYEKMKEHLLRWLPSIQYEKDKSFQFDRYANKLELKRGIMFSKTIIQILSTQRKINETNPLSLINFVLTS